MILSQRINLEQKQTLIMTPRLQQAIQLLQFSTFELNQYVENELKTNPILDREEESEISAEGSVEGLDANLWAEYLENNRYSALGNKIDYNYQEVNYENFVTLKPNLTEYLLAQFNLLTNDSEKVKIAEYLICSLDEKGFLSISPELASESLKVDLVQVREVLQMIQGLDPIGIGAKDLVESLILQSRYHFGEQALLEKIIQDYLIDLSENRIKQIAVQLSTSPIQVQKAADLIKTLNPRPAAKFFDRQDIKFLEPDVFIEKVEGEYVVMMNDQSIPRLRINSYYQKVLRDIEAGQEAKEFLEKKLNSALWLIKSIEQRRMTIYRIVETVVKMQRAFLDHGLKHLQPMTLNEIAEQVGVHESTVSRATANKYVQTPYGIFELKFFFNSGITKKNGEGLASVSVQKIIKEIVQKEAADKPLSDQKIAEEIQKKGYSISRRTVAKYRDELGIPASNKRKRYE